MEILRYPTGMLRQLSANVTEFGTEHLIDLVANMQDFVRTHAALGLAAVQIGVHKRVIVVKSGDKIIHMVNPLIIGHLVTQFLHAEQCLSLNGVFYVPRWKNITVIYQDVHGKYHTSDFEGLDSFVVQHEVDHLSGILIKDYKYNTQL